MRDARRRLARRWSPIKFLCGVGPLRESVVAPIVILQFRDGKRIDEATRRLTKFRQLPNDHRQLFHVAEFLGSFT